MAMRELGRIGEVNVRDIWPYEPQNFTTWLAQPDGLELLGSALGLDLELVRQEAPVGYFWLDILAKETSGGEFVAIENQLEMTDHDHLGKSITYAAENRVGYVIWIAPYFRPEHKKAIDWLNSLAPNRVWFFAVEIHAIQIGDSQPAADFRPVAAPAGWKGGNARYVIPSMPEVSDSQKYLEFFQPLIDELRETGFTDESDASPEAEQRFPSGLTELSYCASFDGDGAWVFLECWASAMGMKWSNRVFDTLEMDKIQIEADLGVELEWYRRGNTSAFHVALRRQVTINDPLTYLDLTRAWMLETLPKFRDAFNPRLEKILADLETE